MSDEEASDDRWLAKRGFISHFFNTLINKIPFSKTMKCSICGNKIENTFLGKIIGTYIKKKPVCPEGQEKYKKEELAEKLK